MPRSRSRERDRDRRRERVERKSRSPPKRSRSPRKRSRSPRRRSRERDRRSRSRSRDRYGRYGTYKHGAHRRDDSRDRDRSSREERPSSPKDSKLAATTIEAAKFSGKRKVGDIGLPSRKKKPKPKPPTPPPETEEEAAMRVLMGFGGFETSHGNHKDGNLDGDATIKKPHKYRQYMNRRGGFNRPLDER